MLTPRATGCHCCRCLPSPLLTDPCAKPPDVIGQYHLPQDPSLLLSISLFLAFLFVCLFCCLISQNLKAFGCSERRRAAGEGWERAEGRQLPMDLVFWG